MAGRDREVGRVDKGRALAAFLGEGSAGRFLGGDTERERERGREGGREGEREREREREREGGRDGGREGGRERERERVHEHVHTLSGHVLLTKLGSWMAVLGFMRQGGVRNREDRRGDGPGE